MFIGRTQSSGDGVSGAFPGHWRLMGAVLRKMAFAGSMGECEGVLEGQGERLLSCPSDDMRQRFQELGRGVSGTDRKGYSEELMRFGISVYCMLNLSEVHDGSRKFEGGVDDSRVYGQKMHAVLYEFVRSRGGGWKSNPVFYDQYGTRHVPDAVTGRGNLVELKPNTPSGRAAGRRQKIRYESVTGREVIILYYEPPARSAQGDLTWIDLMKLLGKLSTLS